MITWVLSVPLLILASIFGTSYLKGSAPSSTPVSTASEPEDFFSTMSKPIEVRPFSKLGGDDHGWLKTRHHFSFANYYDPNRMHWGGLRVWNDDIIESGSGFPPHPHKSMEIVTYVVPPNYHPMTKRVEGGLGIRHQDNTGSDGVTEPGDVQVMSVGSEGVVHAEYNPEKKKGDKTTNIFQLWIMPDKKIEKSTWGTRHFPRSDNSGHFVVFASGFPNDEGALPINSYTRVSGAHLEEGEVATYNLGKDRLGYGVCSKGTVTVNGVKVGPHDGVAIKETDVLNVKSVEDSAEFILVDTHQIVTR